jgi:hypothetical protein
MAVKVGIRRYSYTVGTGERDLQVEKAFAREKGVLFIEILARYNSLTVN